MKTFAICAVAFVSAAVSGIVTQARVEPIAYQAGYAKAEALANWVMAPTPMAEAEAEKHRCEKITGETCYISGVFLPESSTVQGSGDAPEDAQETAEAI